MCKPPKGEQVRVVAAVMSSNAIGRDCVTPVAMEAAQLVAHQAATINTDIPEPAAAVGPTLKATSVPPQNKHQGTGQQPVGLTRPVLPHRGATAGHEVLTEATVQAGNCLKMAGATIAEGSQPALRPVVAIPSYRSARQLTQPVPATPTAIPCQEPRFVVFGHGKQTAMTSTAKPLHVPASNEVLDAEAVHPSSRLVGPDEAQPDCQVGDMPQSALMLPADEGNPESVRITSPLHLRGENQAGEHCQSAILQGSPPHLAASYEGAQEKSSNWPHYQHGAHLPLPGGQVCAYLFCASQQVTFI